jgi:Uma2 family endonuclease
MPMRASTLPSKRKRKLTEAGFLRLPDDGRKYELVDGEAKGIPTAHDHAVIGMRLGARILSCASSRRGYVAGSQAGFRMLSGNIRSPDVAFTLKERLPDGKPSKGFEEGAPDLAVEIVSPNEDAADLLRKVGEYFASGAQQVWLLFPETRTVNLYTSNSSSTNTCNSLTRLSAASFVKNASLPAASATAT